MRWRVFSWWTRVQKEKKPNWAIFLLLPLSVLYGYLQKIHRKRTQRHKVHSNLMVISVGSPRAGGSGKTPFVRAFMKELMTQARAVVVCRGYGATHPLRGAHLVDSKIKGAFEVGDEPWMLSGRATRELKGERLLEENENALPVIVSTRRYEGCELGFSLGYQVAILDDGMQHYELHRDLELAIVTKEDFEDELLPLGSMREPMDALKRCDWIFVKDYSSLEKSHQDQLKALGRPWVGFEMISSHLHVVKKTYGSYEVQVTSWEAYKMKRVLVFAGIAKPHAFFKSVEEHGLVVLDTKAFADHEPIAKKTLMRWMQPYLEKGVEALICTEKDWARLGPSILDLPVEILWPSWQVQWKEQALSFFQELQNELEKRRILKK